MIIVAGQVVVDPDMVDKLRETVKTMEQETRKEPGCEVYAFSVDVNDPSSVRFYERWESEAALQAHMKTPHMAAFNEAVVGFEPKSLDVKVYEVARELPLPT